MKLLVTGFEPFGDQKVNASWLAVSKLPEKLAGIEIVTAEIPVVCYKSVDTVLDLAQKHNVDAILCVGEAGGAAKVRVELIGTNWLDMGIPDNEGNKVINGLSYPDGPDAHFATTYPSEMAHHLHELGLSAELSLSAGAYICNHTLYGVLEKQKRPAGFIHVPLTPEQSDQVPVMETKEVLGVLREAIEFLGRTFN